MDISAVSDQVVALLQQRGRLAYRMLKPQFQLDDEQLAALKEELIDIQEVAVDKEGKKLGWKGDSGARSGPSEVRGSPAPATAQTLPPARSTPPPPARRIRAEQAALETRGIADGERKTITALFADIQDSTTLIEDLDPEAARRLIDPALQLMMDAVHRSSGMAMTWKH